MKSIIYYCGEAFDPSCGLELTAVQWLSRKLLHAKETKLKVDNTVPFDPLRSNRIAEAIEDWQTQLFEIYGSSEEVW